MCAFCGEITDLYEGIFGDWLCCACLRIEEYENRIDQECDLMELFL